MTYRRTQRACRFADRGEKKFTRRIPRLAWREPISPERLRFLCAAVRACQDASIGCRPSPERKRTRAFVSMSRNRRLGFAIVGQLAHAPSQRYAACRFDGNAINRNKNPRTGESIKGFAPLFVRVPNFFPNLPFPSALRLETDVTPTPFVFRGFAIIPRPDIQFLSVLHRFPGPFASRGKKVTNAVGARINKSARGVDHRVAGPTIHAGIHPRFGFGRCATGRGGGGSRWKEGTEGGNGGGHTSLFSSS